MDDSGRLRKDDKFNVYYDTEKNNKMTRKTTYLEDVNEGEIDNE